jgi:Trypsin-like peptidase domain
MRKKRTIEALMNLNKVPGLVVLTAVALTAMTLSSYGQVTSNVLKRTFLIQVALSQVKSEFGTAFTIDVDDRQYIVTAKHVVNTLPNEADSTIQILTKNGWSPLKVKVFKCDDPVDIAVLVPSAQLTVSYPLEPSSVGLEVGEDAYFIGFPYGARSAKTYSSLPGVFGVAKKATVAQFDSMPQRRAQRILLDGYNNPGFSGSPVVYRDLRQSGMVFKVAGVLVDFIYDASPVVKKKQEIQENQITAEDRASGDVVFTITDGRFYRVEETGELVKLNTGIATAWDIGSAIDLIQKHPIGPQVSSNFTEDSVGVQSPAPKQ